MLYKIRCNPKHPLCGALPVTYVPVRLIAVLWSHIGILLRLPAAEPRSITRLLFPFQYLFGMIWVTPYFMVWDLRVSRAGPMPFCWPGCSLFFCLQLFSLSLIFLYRLVVWGWVFGLIGCQSPSPGLALPIFFNNNNNIAPAGAESTEMLTLLWFTSKWNIHTIVTSQDRLAGHHVFVKELQLSGVLFFVLFWDSFLNSCGCSTAESKTPPQKTIFSPTYRYRAWVSTIPDHSW